LCFPSWFFFFSHIVCSPQPALDREFRKFHPSPGTIVPIPLLSFPPRLSSWTRRFEARVSLQTLPLPEMIEIVLLSTGPNLSHFFASLRSPSCSSFTTGMLPLCPPSYPLVQRRKKPSPPDPSLTEIFFLLVSKVRVLRRVSFAIRPRGKSTILFINAFPRQDLFSLEDSSLSFSRGSTLCKRSSSWTWERYRKVEILPGTFFVANRLLARRAVIRAGHGSLFEAGGERRLFKSLRYTIPPCHRDLRRPARGIQYLKGQGFSLSAERRQGCVVFLWSVSCFFGKLLVVC